MNLYGYAKCSTCIKAKKYLTAHDVAYTYMELMEQPPSAEMFLAWSRQFEIPMDQFFNKQGTKFKALGLKEILPTKTDSELATLLASDGYLVKRPLLVSETNLVLGFKEVAYQNIIGGTKSC
ncbi:MAG: Spx/MgsR family RNA polymerase-binding regulatory protein [Erysipelotrichaceae bacterium]